jgi:hypothetical protein
MDGIVSEKQLKSLVKVSRKSDRFSKPKILFFSNLFSRMEAHSGLRSRTSVTAEGQISDYSNCEKRLKSKSWSPVRLWAIILKILNMKGQRSTPLLIIACLGT